MALLSALTVVGQEAPTVDFEPGSGFYRQRVTVELRAPGADAIFYTLDGSTPTRHALRYREAIVLYKSTVVRAIALREGQSPRVFGASYLIDEPETSFPVVSVAMDPERWFHPDYGLFRAGGEVADEDWKMPGANFWSHQEYPAHFDIFEPDGRAVFTGTAGFRLFGGMSRLFKQKSFSISCRKEYGPKRIDYPLFGPDGPKDFKYLVLRNSGSDWSKSHFRDGFMTRVAAPLGLDQQAFRPAHVYLNGKYWGIYNLREKINRTFLADHHDLDRDSVDLIEHYLTRKYGSTQHYRRLLRYLETQPLDQPAVWAEVQRRMDVDNFQQLQIAQVYFDNRDAGGNIRFWRPQTEDGRWRWILFDTDFGFGLHHSEAWRFNTLAFLTEPDGPAWPNPPWSTFILRRLLTHPGFRQSFLDRFCDHLNLTFAPARVEHLLDSFATHYRPELPRQYARWGMRPATWQFHLDRMRTFARQRPAVVREHLRVFFGAGPDRRLQVAVGSGGNVWLNDHLVLPPEGLDGTYFARSRVTLRAMPAYGYRFVGWEGVPATQRRLREIRLDLSTPEARSLRAVFEPYEHPLRDAIVINEVCPKSKATGDWVELYNRSDSVADLRDWVFTDHRHEFRLHGIQLAAGDYLVLCRDLDRFRRVHPTTHNVIGGLDFGINKRGERLGLYSRDGAIVDVMDFRLPRQDTSFSYALLQPDMDNTLTRNWHLYPGPGSPARANPYFLSTYVQSTQQYWLRYGAAFGLVLVALLGIHWRRNRRIA
jgi:hypothetical protein